MAIIDLGIGAVESTSDQPTTIPGRIIDLKTGGFVSDNQVLADDASASLDSKPENEAGLFEMATGSKRIADNPELGTLPEFGSTPEGDTFKIAAGMLSTFDPKAQMDIIQQAIPDAVFETLEDGTTIIETPTESGAMRRSVLNRPGFSPQDLTTSVTQALSFFPAAKIASLGKTLAAKIGIGAAASGATEQGLQEVGVALGREERDPASTAVAAVTGGAAEAVIPAIQAFRAGRQAKQLGAAVDEVAEIAPNVRTAREASDETGIDLFQAQQTASPSQLEKQSFIPQLPAGSQTAVKALKVQNKQAGEAVERFLSSIAPDDSVISGAEKVRGAAQSSIDRIKNIRSEKASPLYSQAFEESASVDIQPVRELIISKLDDFPETGEVAVTLKKALGLIKGIKMKGGDIAPPTLKKLHNAKIEIDQMINSRGSDSIGNTTKRELQDVQSYLLEQIDDASPSYASAREAFKNASPDVVKAQESIIGKIAELDDTQLKQVATKLFDPSQTNPSVVINAKKAIQDVDPGAWDQIVRTELERRLGSIKPTEAGTVENIPGQMFRALFPNEKSTKVLMNSLDAEGKRNLTYLKNALGRARLGRPGGSQTAAREEMKQELRGGIFQTFRQLFKAPLNTLASTGEDAAFNGRVSTMAKALFDPTWKAEMKEIRSFNPNSPDAMRAMTQLLNDIESSESNN